MSEPPQRAGSPRRGGRPLRNVVIERRSLYDPVADHLRDMIVRGDLAGGEKVPVAELAAELGVSITPLREALKVLAEEQLIELLPNRGARVLAYTVEEAEALFDVIASLESLAAELAAARMSSADLADLEAMHAEMRAHFNAGAREPYFRLNSRIHSAIVRLSGNPVLVSTHERLMIRATRGRYMAIVDTRRWHDAMDEHEQLMDALIRRDEQAAGRIWRQHLRNTGIAVRTALTAPRPAE